MKKLAIMFVMLLGSVATMQAQSNATFNFSCPVVQADFTEAQGVVLVAAGFEANDGNYQHMSNTGIVIELGSDGLYHVINEDTQSDDTFSDLAAAIVAADAAVGLPDNSGDNGNGAGTNPDADDDGILDAHEITLNLDLYGFVEVSPGMYRWIIASKYVTLSPNGFADNGDALYEVAEYATDGTLLRGPWTGTIGDSIGTSRTLING